MSEDLYKTDPKFLYPLPKPLKEGDEITLKCGIMYPQGLKIKLVCGLVSGCVVPDYRNIAYELKLYIPSTYSGDTIKMNAVVDGKYETLYKTLKQDPNLDFGRDFNFDVTLKIKPSTEHQDSFGISVTIGNKFITEVGLFHNLKCVRFLAIYEEIVRVNSITITHAGD